MVTFTLYVSRNRVTRYQVNIFLCNAPKNPGVEDLHSVESGPEYTVHSAGTAARVLKSECEKP